MQKKTGSGWFAAALLAAFLLLTPPGRSLLSSPGSQASPPAHSNGCRYAALIQLDAISAGIPVEYFLRQIIHESNCDPAAVGHDGEEGIAQFMPDTARGLGLRNPFDPGAALWAAARLMARYQGQFGGDYAKALAAYNAGSGTVRAAERCEALWLTCLSAGTRDYVNTILSGS
jgi:soluble lytic murein transglycosylase-like protein